jgi:hypothetical protein
MRKVLNFGAVGIIAFLLGVLAGLNIDVGTKYLAGQLDACTRVIKMDPILALANVACVPHDGQVVLQVGDKLYSLDGKQLN